MCGICERTASDYLQIVLFFGLSQVTEKDLFSICL